MARPKQAPATPKRRKRGTGSVGRRSDDRLFAVLPSHLDPARRPIYTSPTTGRAWASEDEAAAWLDARIVESRTPRPPPSPSDELLGVYAMRWHRDHAQLWPPRTARAYGRAMTLVLTIGELRAVPVGRLAHDAVRGALSRLTAATWQRQRADGTVTRAPAPYSRRTVQQARMVLGMALSDLVPDVLPANPVRRARLPKAQAPEQPVWDGEQAERFLAAAEQLCPHLALAYRLILRRALRRGEVLTLRWTDVDERRGVLVVERTAGQRAGDSDATKGRRVREIPLSHDLLERLRLQKSAAVRPSPWVIANPETGLPYHAEVLSHWIPAICKTADLPVIQPKDMRATCATNLLEEGVPLPTVSLLLGHRDVSVTASAYVRPLQRRQELLARQAEELDAAHERASRAARERAPTPLERPNASRSGS